MMFGGLRIGIMVMVHLQTSSFVAALLVESFGSITTIQNCLFLSQQLALFTAEACQRTDLVAS
jgi:hypothetical protein